MKQLVALVMIAFLVPATATVAFAKNACKDEKAKFCKDAKTAGKKVNDCLKEHIAEVSPACKNSSRSRRSPRPTRKRPTRRQRTRTRTRKPARSPPRRSPRSQPPHTSAPASPGATESKKRRSAPCRRCGGTANIPLPFVRRGDCSPARLYHDSYSDAYIGGILASCRTFAFVGASPTQSRPNRHFAMKYLMAKGYRVIPVNPGHAGKELLGQKIYASLADIGEPVDAEQCPHS